MSVARLLHGVKVKKKKINKKMLAYVPVAHTFILLLISLSMSSQNVRIRVSFHLTIIARTFGEQVAHFSFPGSHTIANNERSILDYLWSLSICTKKQLTKAITGDPSSWEAA